MAYLTVKEPMDAHVNLMLRDSGKVLNACDSL